MGAVVWQWVPTFKEAATRREGGGGHVKFYPYAKGGGGKNRFSHPERGGGGFQGSFYMVHIA